MNGSLSTRRVTPGKASGTRDPELIFGGVVIAALAALALVLVGAVHLSGAQAAGNPATLALDLAQGRTPWTGAMTAWAITLTLAIIAVTLACLWAYSRRSVTRAFDRAAPLMGRGREIEFLTARGCRKLGNILDIPRTFGPGLPLGRAVCGGTALYSNWETCTADVWGPRRGKTRTRIIPAILSAPGPVLATSNKYDHMIKATRAFRSRLGRIWLFDLQDIAKHQPDFWWNPLSYITDDRTAEEAVSVLAVTGVPNSAGAGGGSAEFFQKAASRLLKSLLLAAAVDRLPPSVIAQWTTDPAMATDAADILERHNWPLLAGEVRAAVASPPDQRGGVFETALNWASVFTLSTVQQWITDPRDGRPHFDARSFVRSTDTAYVLSQGSADGGSSAGPIATLLLVAICEAAEDLAAEQGGRLTVPLVAPLDEAGNVIRWPAMPEKYTHYGSRGILLMAMFQSVGQGVTAFGKEGWDTLWDAAGIAVYGGGTKTRERLEDFSQLIGNYQYESVSRSSGRGGGSVSRSLQTERILDVAALAAIPKGRAIAFVGSAPPVVIKTTDFTLTTLGKKAKAAAAAAVSGSKTTVDLHNSATIVELGKEPPR